MHVDPDGRRLRGSPGSGVGRAEGGVHSAYGTRDNVSVRANILIVDNYDSFVFNLAQYLAQLGARVDVRRNDEVSTAEAAGYDGVLLSPGPGDPHDAGVCMDMVSA